jgi:hypothetical protein
MVKSLAGSNCGTSLLAPPGGSNPWVVGASSHPSGKLKPQQNEPLREIVVQVLSNSRIDSALGLASGCPLALSHVHRFSSLLEHLMQIVAFPDVPDGLPEFFGGFLQSFLGVRIKKFCRAYPNGPMMRRLNLSREGSQL